MWGIFLAMNAKHIPIRHGLERKYVHLTIYGVLWVLIKNSKTVVDQKYASGSEMHKMARHLNEHTF